MEIARPDRSPMRPAIGSTVSRRPGRGPICGSPASTGRSAPGCCCCRAGGRRRSPRSPRTPSDVASLLAHPLLFFIGAFAMRGAGCTWNDIVDRDLDGSVERTRVAPIPVRPGQRRASALFMVAAGAGRLAVLIRSTASRSWLGIASLVIVAIYPFMKRDHLLAADRARPGLFLGRADGLGRPPSAGSIRRRSCSMPDRSPG